MKIRINDLARELEVKSKQILDVLIKVGVTEKKTHSSSVEADEAEKVRKYFQENSGAPNRHRAGGEEFRPKIDLSKISKPGDALKAILARKEPPVETVAPPPPPPAPPKAIVNKPSAPRPAPPVVPERAPRLVTPQSVAMRSQVSTVEMPKPPAAAVPPPPAPDAEVAAPPAPTPPPPPVEAPVAAAPPEITVPETPVAAEPTAVPVDTAPAATVSNDAPAPVAPAAEAEPASPAAAAPAKPAGHKPPQAGSARPQTPGQPPAPPARRMIVPQTGPRPVYTAPPPPPPRAPQPPSMGNRTGLPVRGQPIFQRPRPGQSSGPAGAPGAAPARVRRCVLASVAPCIPLAPLPLLADVLRWVDVPGWARVLVVRPVRVVCWVLPPVRHLLEPHLVLAPA